MPKFYRFRFLILVCDTLDTLGAYKLSTVNGGKLLTGYAQYKIE